MEAWRTRVLVLAAFGGAASVVVACGPAAPADLSAHAKAQYDCTEPVTAVGVDEYEACGYRFKSTCTFSIIGSGDHCSFETTPDMAKANLEHGLGAMAGKDLACEDEVVVRIDGTATLAGGGTQPREGERALVARGCGKQVHYVCPSTGDADALEKCRKIPDDELDYRRAATFAHDQLSKTCKGPIQIDRVEVDGAKRVLLESELVVAVIARGCERAEAYTCVPGRGDVVTCREARPSTEIEAAFEGEATAWATKNGTSRGALGISRGRGRWLDKLVWTQWSQLSEEKKGTRGYVFCKDDLFDPAAPTCAVASPSRSFDPTPVAAAQCKTEGVCEDSGRPATVRGDVGDTVLVDVRKEHDVFEPYRCTFDVDEVKYRCEADAVTKSALRGIDDRARAAFSKSPDRAACPASDIRLEPLRPHDRAYFFDAKGCGKKIGVSCPDDGSACSAASERRLQ